MNYIHIYEDIPEDETAFGKADFVTDGIAVIEDSGVVHGFYRPMANIDLREQAAVFNFSTNETAVLTVSPQWPEAVDDREGARRLLKRMASAWLRGEVLTSGCEVVDDNPFVDTDGLREEALKHGSLPS